MPQRGHKVELVRMAEQNAADEAERATTREERQNKLMQLLGSLLGLKETPSPHRVLRHLQHRFRRYRGGPDGVCGRQAPEAGLPVL